MQKVMRYLIPRRLCVALFGVFTFCVATVSADTVSEVREKLTPRSAREIKDYKKRNHDYYQRSFIVSLDYPKSAISAERESSLLQTGWHKCTGRDETWSNYYDAARSRRQFVKLRAFRRETWMLLVVERYFETGAASQVESMRRPRNQTQHVTIIASDEKENLDAVAAATGFDCH